MMGKNEIIPTPRPVDFEQEEQLEHYLEKLLNRFITRWGNLKFNKK
jgi:hypothetical protein